MVGRIRLNGHRERLKRETAAAVIGTHRDGLRTDLADGRRPCDQPRAGVDGHACREGRAGRAGERGGNQADIIEANLGAGREQTDFEVLPEQRAIGRRFVGDGHRGEAAVGRQRCGRTGEETASP